MFLLVPLNQYCDTGHEKQIPILTLIQSASKIYKNIYDIMLADTVVLNILCGQT